MKKIQLVTKYYVEARQFYAMGHWLGTTSIIGRTCAQQAL